MRLRQGIVAAAIAILAIGLASGARAQMWVGVEGGGAFTNTEVGAGTFSANGVGSSGFLGGGRVGYDWRMGSSPFFLGAFGYADWSNVSTDISGSAVATEGSRFGGGVRAGIESRAGSKVYGLLGVQRTDVSYSGLLGKSGLPTAFNGVVVGGGVSMPVASNIDLGLEARYTDNQSTTVGNSSFSMQPRDLAVLATLQFHWGETSFTAPASAHTPLK